jgi:hypothetical protein
MEEATDCAAVLVLLNPFNYTAWNTRKRAVVAASTSTPRISSGTYFDLLARELALADAVQGAHRKAGETWAHRRWVMEQAVQAYGTAVAAPNADGSTASGDLDLSLYLIRLLNHELQAANRCTEAYARNYAAWAHRTLAMRLWVTACQRWPQIAQATLAAAGSTTPDAAGYCVKNASVDETGVIAGLTVAECEFASTAGRVRIIPRDYSAWSYRQACMRVVFAVFNGVDPKVALNPAASDWLRRVLAAEAELLASVERSQGVTCAEDALHRLAVLLSTRCPPR